MITTGCAQARASFPEPGWRRSQIPGGADPGEDVGPVVTCDLIEQAAGVCGHARGTGNGTGQDEGLTRLRGPVRIAAGRGESAQRQRAGLARVTFRSASASSASAAATGSLNASTLSRDGAARAGPALPAAASPAPRPGTAAPAARPSWPAPRPDHPAAAGPAPIPAGPSPPAQCRRWCRSPLVPATLTACLIEQLFLLGPGTLNSSSIAPRSSTNASDSPPVTFIPRANLWYQTWPGSCTPREKRASPCSSTCASSTLSSR
jgi:hypothetical protein